MRHPATSRNRVALLLLLLPALGAVGACAPPREKLTRIAPEVAPFFGEPEDDGPPASLLHAGDLVGVVRGVKQIEWKGTLEGAPATRSGEIVEVHPTSGRPTGFVFRSDLGEEVEVPGVGWLCRRIHGTAECESRLHRTLFEGRLIAWEECQSARCPMALVDGRKVATLDVAGLGELRALRIAKQPVALATTRWVREPNVTGASIVVIRLGATPTVALEIITDEIDNRRPVQNLRTGRVKINADGFELHGEKKMINPMGQVLFRADLNETYKLAPLVK